MAVQVQYRYGTTVEHATYTGGFAEMTVDTTKHVVVVHDSIKQAGYPLAREDLNNVPTLVGATSNVAGTAGKIPVPQAGDQAKYLAGNGTWTALPTSTGLAVTTDATAARTLSLGDTDSYLRFTSTSTKTLTVPTNASVAFPIGTTISGINAGAGQLTIAATSGVTINTPETLLLRNKANTSFVLTKVATNVWDLAGDLQAAS